jgi:hypothetical protein
MPNVLLVDGNYLHVQDSQHVSVKTFNARLSGSLHDLHVHVLFTHMHSSSDCNNPVPSQK